MGREERTYVYIRLFNKLAYLTILKMSLAEIAMVKATFLLSRIAFEYKLSHLQLTNNWDLTVTVDSARSTGNGGDSKSLW